MARIAVERAMCPPYALTQDAASQSRLALVTRTSRSGQAQPRWCTHFSLAAILASWLALCPRTLPLSPDAALGGAAKEAKATNKVTGR